MEPILAFILFPLSMVFLVKGADIFLEGASKIGYAIGVTPFVVGAFIVGFGTSLPEIAIVVSSVFGNQLDIPVASAIGSNIANILLVLGISVILARKIIIQKNLIDLELPILASITILFVVLSYDGVVTVIDSVFLLIVFMGYMLYIFLHEDNRTYPKDLEEIVGEIVSLPKSFLHTLLGAVVVYLSAKFTVDSAVSIAEFLNVSGAIIGVTAIALGTSLPELVVSAKAAINKQAEIAIGNIIGSNIFNLTLVVGVAGVFNDLIVDERTLLIGIPALFMATLLFILSSMTNKISVWEGALFILAYLLFIGKIIGIL